VGRVRYVKGDRIHLAAFDGKTGDRLWQAQPIGNYSDTYQGKTSIVGRTVLFGGAQGELQAFSLQDGKRLWRIPLGEKTDRICRDQEGMVTVKTIDGALHRVRLADGTSVKDGEPPSGCDALPHDRRDGDPALTRTRGRHPRIKGMQFHGAWQLGTDGPVVVTGTREKGTRVPMVAVLTTGSEPAWKSEVPGEDRLRVRETAPELIAIDRERLYILYRQDNIQKPLRLTVFQMSDGRRLWESTLQTTMPTSAIQTTGDRLLVSSWGRLDAYQPADGKLLYTIGWSMK
jgi:outer membrane protein assembly factor BamB